MSNLLHWLTGHFMPTAKFDHCPQVTWAVKTGGEVLILRIPINLQRLIQHDLILQVSSVLLTQFTTFKIVHDNAKPLFGKKQ